MTPARKPKGRTLAEFEPLQPAEEMLLDACWQGKVARIAASRPEAAHENNTVRAGFLRFLALGGDGQAPVHERGVRLQGAWITDTLDMTSASIPSDLSMLHCQFNETPLFTGTNIAGTLDFTGSRLLCFIGQRMVVNGNLDFNNATLDGENDHALLADSAVIKGNVILQKTRAIKTVSLLDAQIGGSLKCINAIFDGKDGDALSASRAIINGSISLINAHTTGTVGLLGARIGESLNCTSAKFDGKEGDALSADRVVIKGTIFLKQARVIGKVRLLGAEIGSNLDCTNATFDDQEGHALAADRAVIKGDISLKYACATGEVRLSGTRIDGSLICTGVTFDGKEGVSLSADRAVIQGTVFLENARTTGTVRLPGAQIGSNLLCNDARFDGKEGVALSADRAVIKGDIFLKNACTTGAVRLPGAQIGGSLICTGVTFDGKGNNALFADNMAVNNMFKFRTTQSANKISLAGAHVGWLADDIASWGKCIILNGFTYGNIASDAPTDAATRLAWLDKQLPEHAGLNVHGADFKPQPWRQLAKVLREMGHAEDARQVSIAFEERLRQADLIGKTPVLAKDMCPQRSWIYRKTSRILHWWFGALTGYGYRPLRLLSWVLGVWLFCAAIYWGAALKGGYAPSSPPVFQNPAYAVCEPPKNNWYLCSQLSEAYSGFSPLAYSLDVILPFVDLQQETRWSPLIPTPIDPWYAEFFANWSWQHTIRLLVWFETLFGWLSGLLLAAVVSGLAKRREE